MGREFWFLEYPSAEDDEFWSEAGWDVNHGGEPLLLMKYLGRQLVCVIDQLLPEATFSADGNHTLVSEKLLASRLEEEARQFAARKRRRA